MEVKGASRLKKKAYRAWLACRTSEKAYRYRLAKQHAAMAKAKTRVWKEFREAMEKDFWTALQRFWQIIRRLKRGKRRCTCIMYIAGGALLNIEHCHAVEGILRGPPFERG